jgi:hypothetical protein
MPKHSKSSAQTTSCVDHARKPAADGTLIDMPEHSEEDCLTSITNPTYDCLYNNQILKATNSLAYFASVRRIHDSSLQALARAAQALSSAHHDKLCQPTQSRRNNTQPLNRLPVHITAKHDGPIYHEGFR